MIKKEIYETPEMEVVEFDTEDIITASPPGYDEGMGKPMGVHNFDI